MCAFRVIAALPDACVVCFGAQQVVECFDTLILMREGAIIYNGPRESVAAYLDNIGVRPASAEDSADFLVKFLTHPQLVYDNHMRTHIRKQLNHRPVRVA